MTPVTAFAAAAVLLALLAGAELLPRRDESSRTTEAHGGRRRATAWEPIAIADARLGLSGRLARAGLVDRVTVSALLLAKLGGAVAGVLWAAIVAPAAPARIGWVVVVGLPAAGFLGPDVWLEHRARRRLRTLRARLPDAMDLLAVGTAAGRSALAGLSELGRGEGPLAKELAMLSAESSCGFSQSEALASLRRRAPVPEVAAMCAVIERSRRFGSPLADQLQEQATALRAVQRRRIEEQAARAAPKIQLAVALLLVPSVLLMIAAGLLANVDRFLAGF
jgi:tight adherence protein C